jgi:PKD repeat protein
MTLPSFLPARKFIVTVSLMLSIASICYAQQANFTADVTSGCAPLTVKFTDTSTGAITGWAWDFGNTNSSSLKDPSAIFSTPGAYTVKLTAFAGAASSTKTLTINVRANPTADFAVDKTSGCSPLTVNFTDKSNPGEGASAQWTWVFGDGGSSTDQHPHHVYNTPGGKNISLEVKNQYGCKNIVTKSSAIQVQGPKAGFNADTKVFCQVPATVNFSNTTTGDAPITYAWDFGDGKTSTQKDPSSTYTVAGNYNPILTATDAHGCIGKASILINAGSEGGLEVIPSASKLCIGRTLSFTVLADVPITSYEWTFGNNTSSSIANPSLEYNKAGNYIVTLKAQLLGKSCQSIVTIPIQVLDDAVPSFTYTVDCNYKVTFTNTSTKATRISWELINLATTSENKFSYIYPGVGDYNVRLTAYNGLDCSTVLNRTIHVSGKPIAAFKPAEPQGCGQSLSGCAPFALQFTNVSVSESTFTSKWSFGDAATSTSTAVSPAHTYTTAGTFTVNLEIKNTAGCVSTTSSTVTVSSTTPVAKFSVSKSNACAQEPLRFTDLSTNANFWCWDFGDGATSNEQSPFHSYQKPGTYTVKLVAKNAGCASIFQITNAVTIKDPFVDFKIVKSCADTYTIQLVNLATNFTSVQWDFGDGTITSSNVTTHKYAATGNYIVALTAKNSTSLCSVTSSINVSIYDVKADFVVDNPKPCKDAPVTFTDKSQSAAKWQWTFGNGLVAATQNATTQYSQAGQFTASLFAYDADNCMSTKSVTIDVLDINGDFNFSGTSTCDKLTIQFHDLSSATPAIQTWLWDFGDGKPTSNATDPLHVYTAKGSYPVKLTLTNGNGTCSFIRYDAVTFTVPVPDFTTFTRGGCIGMPIQLINQTTDAITFVWSFDSDNMTTSTDVNPRVTYPAIGDYDITLKATDQYGCEKGITKPKYLSITQPVADFEAYNTSSDCPPLISRFEDKSAGSISTWTWNFGDGENTSLTNDTQTWTYLRPGIFDVSLLVTDVNGCTDKKVKSKLVDVGGPYGNFVASTATQFCLYDSTSFIATTTNAIIHRWDFGDGNVVDLSDSTASHIYSKTGPFQVALLLIDANGCQVVADGSTQIIVQDTTAIDFTYPSCIFTDEGSFLQANPPVDSLGYEWFVDQQSVGTGPTLPLTLSTSGDHQVILKAINKIGCPSSLIRNIPVQGDVYKVPNVFTPNEDDDINRRFEVQGIERSSWDLFVYNRWGRPVFHDKNYVNTWDGGDLSTGVYYFVLQNTICPTKNHKGPVSIAR